MTNYERYVALVRSFPVMRFAPGIVDTGPVIAFAQIDEWAVTKDPDGREGIRATVSFLLNLWHSSHPWRVGKFDLFAALLVWDDEQRAAWKAWAADPWRP